MVTAKRKKRYPACLAYAVIGMFYSVIANQRQPQYTYNVLQRRYQPRPPILYILRGGQKPVPDMFLMVFVVGRRWGGGGVAESSYALVVLFSVAGGET